MLKRLLDHFRDRWNYQLEWDWQRSQGVPRHARTRFKDFLRGEFYAGPARVMTGERFYKEHPERLIFNMDLADAEARIVASFVVDEASWPVATSKSVVRGIHAMMGQMERCEAEAVRCETNSACRCPTPWPRPTAPPSPSARPTTRDLY